MPAWALLVAMTAGWILAAAPPVHAETVIQNGFEDDTWTDGLVDVRSLDLTRTEVIGAGYAGNALRVAIPTGGFRGLGPFARLEPAADEAWYRYYVRLLNWNPVFSGKLPGLSGIYSASARGCIPSTETSPGWSARGLFGAVGTQGAPPGSVPIGTYLYHLDQQGTCGDDVWWPHAFLEQGRWTCIEGHVRLNTPGQNDGLVEGWLGGQHMLTKNGVAFRRADEGAIGIRQMWLNVYFGGSYPTPNPLSLVVDQVEVSTSGRVGCLDPFTDDNDSIHVGALTELHALGLLYGCGYRLACPDRQLTRAEAAALFSRVLELPASTKDYFVDDNDSVFEGVINSLAASGITLGCDPPVNRHFCPDELLTRAQFAAMTVRALHLPPKTTDAFSDDQGHWAEADINSFANAGITKGCSSDGFCPERPLIRGEAASFFVRIHRLIQPIGQASVPPPAQYPPSGPPPVLPPDETD
jgi:Polysaccharide lyase 14/S-layer homology domain